MKLHILFPFRDGPYGGGNQFLKALKEYFLQNDTYSDNIAEADVVIFNLNPSSMVILLNQVKKIRETMPDKLIISRIDGPVFLIRGKDLLVDKAFFAFNRAIADGTVFQSIWSRDKCLSLGMEKMLFEEVIGNAPDHRLFNSKGKKGFRHDRKTRLIATSWSANWRKGFGTYKWLDQNLDFSRYEMVFVGNSPVNFINILHIEPLDSPSLAAELKKNDIFITASQKDPCSNSLIEALHCGLPAIALKDGGHPALIKQAGELFNKPEEIPCLLEKISSRYHSYQQRINVPTMEEVGNRYYGFIKCIDQEVRSGQYKPKRLNRISYCRINALLVGWRMLEGARSRLGRWSTELFS